MNNRLELEILEPRILLSADAVLDMAATTDGDELLGENLRPETATVITNGFEGEGATPDAPSPQDYQPEAQLPGLFDGLNEISTEAPSPAPVESEPEPSEPKGPGSESTSGRSFEVRKLTSLPPDQSTKQDPQLESTLPDSESAARSITEELVESLHAANAPPAEAETSWVIQQDEELTGNHSLAINLVNHGVVSPGNSPGIDNVSTFNQGPDGTTVIEIGGTDGPGVDPSGHDQINVSGLAELHGTLELQLINGFSPSAGDTFTIFTWGSRTGEFANYLGTAGIPGSPDLAIQPVYNASDLTLEVVQTPTIIPGAESTIDDGLDSLAQIGDALDSAGEFAESIPFIGETLGDLVDAGTAINDVLRLELTDLLGSVTRQSEVTSGIEDLNGTTVAGFTLQVNGVLGHYGTVDTDPFWWDVDLAIVPSAVNHAFEAGSQTVLGAAFNPDPQVQVNSSLNLDFAFGLDSGFFVELEELTGQAEVDTSGLSGFDVDLAPPGGAVSLSVTDGSIVLDASVTATPDASILTGGRITAGTLSDIADGTINAGDAFNLDEAGSIDAALTLDGTLSGFAFDFSGTHTVRIQSTELFSGQDPDLTLEIDGTLVVAGQTLNGVFKLKKTATETLIEASDVNLELQAGAGGSAQTVLEATNGSGTFLVLDDELAGTASLSLGNGPDHANLDLTGTTLNLAFNSSGESVETIGGDTVNLPAGPYYRVSGTAVISLTDPEAELSGDFTFEPFDPTPAMSGSGDEVVTVGAANLSFEFDDGTDPLLQVNNGSGAFVFTENGILGETSADVALAVSDVGLSGTFDLALNDTNAAYSATVEVNDTSIELDLPAGPFLRVTGDGVELEILDTELTGNFSFEQQTTDTGGEKVVTVAASDVSLDLGTPSTDLLELTNGSGAFILTQDGVSGQGSVDANLTLAAVGLTGTFTLRINDTETAVDETVTIGGSTETIDLPAGPFLQINADDAVLTVFGVAITGDYSFEQRQTEDGDQLVTIVASDVRFDFGDDVGSVLSMENGEGLLLVTESGVAGRGSIEIGANLFGETFEETFDFEFNNTESAIDELVDWEGNLQTVDLPEGPLFQVIGVNIDIAVNAAGQTQTLTGDFVFSQIEEDSTEYVAVGVSNLSTTLGAGSVSLDVSGGSGGFVLTSDGLAGEATVTSASLNGVTGVTVAVTDLALEINNTGGDVGPVTIILPDETGTELTIEYTGAYFHDYLALAGGATLELSGFANLQGRFAFETSDSDPNQFKVAAENLMLDLKAGTTTVVSFHNGEGAFLISSDGVAGEAELEFDAGVIGLSGDIVLQINTTDSAVNTTLTTPLGSTPINFTETEFLKICVQGNLHLGSTALPFDFIIEVDTGTGAVEFRDKTTDDLLLSVASDGTISTDLSFDDFAQPGPFQFVSMLRQLANWFAMFSDSDLFDVTLPFTGGATLGETLDWSQLFLDEIFSHMVSLELQSREVSDAGSHSGTLTNATFTIRIGDDDPVEVTVDGTYNNLTELVALFNTAFAAPGTSIDDKVQARLNKDGQLVIALTPGEIADHSVLELRDADAQIEDLGFGPDDGDDTTTDQVGVETARYDTEEFFVELGNLLGLTVNYDPAVQVYTYTVDEDATFSMSLPFELGGELGDIAAAELSGELTINAEVGFEFTLGFDLGAEEVPRILTSSLVPVPANGQISDDANFEIFLNDDVSPLSLTLAQADTNNNSSIEDLADDLNTLFADPANTWNGTPLDELLYAQKAGSGLAISVLNEDFDGDGHLDVDEDANDNGELDDGEDADGDGNLDREEDLNGNGNLDNQLGIINRLTIRSHQDDPFATELGFGVEALDLDDNPGTTNDQYFQSTSNSTIKGLFVEDANLAASVEITTDTAIDGSLRLGFVEISSSGGDFGTLDFEGTASNPISTEIALANPTSGDARFYLTDLYTNLDSADISNLVQGPEFEGSFLARLDNVAVNDGLIPLGSDPEISVWIPDINDLEYNPEPYDGSNTGVFVTYPDLGQLTRFRDVTFTQIIQVLDTVADNLSQLSAFSFLDEKLPFIDVSVNDLIDYAGSFAEIVDGTGNSNSSSLQQLITDLETQIEQLFDLDPSILSVSFDDSGILTDPVAGGAVDGSSPATATFNPDGDNNGLIFTSTANDESFNGATIKVVGNSSLSGDEATATWDATNKILTIGINGGETTANTIITAVGDLSGAPWTAGLVTNDNDSGTNTGDGTITTTALKFSFDFTTGYANNLPFQLDLAQLVSQLGGDNTAAKDFLEAATDFIQIEGSGSLTVNATAGLSLDFGLDLTDPTIPVPFFYDSTGVELTAQVLGTDIEFEASLGSVVGIFIKEGRVTLDADGDPDTGPDEGDQGARFRLGLNDNNGDGRHYFSEDWFDAENIDLSLEAGVSAELPIFAPSKTTPLDGETDENGDGYPDNQLVINIPSLVRLFVDDQANGATATLPFAGNNNDFTVTATSATDYTVELVHDPELGSPAAAEFNGNTLTLTIKSGTTTANQAIAAINSLSGFSASLTSDDDGDPDTTGNDGSGTLNKLTIVTPDFGALFDSLDFCSILDNHAGLLLDGLDALLGNIQDGLEDVALSNRLPLVGDGLADAADFISEFRNGLLLDLRRAIDEAGGSATTAIENAIKEVFWNTLGPDGLDWLVNPDDASELDPSLGFHQLDVNLDCEEGLMVNLRLRKELALVDTSSNPIDVDIGIPGFGLEVEGNVKVALSFDLKLGFGLNQEDGFFFDSSAPASDPELQVGFEATIPGLAASGQLAFLQLDVSDDEENPSFFKGGFEVDLMDPDSDGKLTFSELTSSGTEFSDIIDGRLGAQADVNLNLAASFGGNTAFPRVLADFHLDWEWDLDDGAGTPQITFDNVALDLGTFISDFLGPILEEIRKVTEPLDPIIEIATARLPVISDLAGQDLTLLDLAEIFGVLEPSTVQFIDSVLQIVDLINDLEGIGEGSILIPFGAFNLNSNGNGEMDQIAPIGNLDDINLEDTINAATGPGTSETYKSQTAGFAGNLDSLDNFSIPIFENPAELFNIFIGEPVQLVEWRMPTFLFEFTYTQKIPIYPPLYAQFGGSIGAKIEIGFGYDTFGIQKFIASEDKDPIDLLDGFHVLDFDENGNERDELQLTGEIFAGATLDLLVAEAGVRGGIFAVIGFDLNDVNDDGKVRVSEIIANAQQDPRCIFNIHGEMGLFLEAFLKIDLFFFSFSKEWRFAEITLFEFDITCPEPILAEQSGSELKLNIGSRASDREEIDTNDNAEQFIVTHVDGSAGNETVEVQWGSYSAEFEGVGKIVVEDAGKGDDLIDLRGVLAETEVHGGEGNDTIYLGNGDNSAGYGDEGNDLVLAGEGANQVLYGGVGNDILTAGPLGIEIHGDGGADVITGSKEQDDLFGDAGADTIEGGAGNDTIEGGDGNDDIEGNAGDDTLFGNAGNDYLRGSRGNDEIDGGGGEDEILGGSGNDLLAGGDDDDQINGHGGIDLIIGDQYDTVVGNLEDIPTNGIEVRGLTGDGDDTLIGGGNIDVLFGGDGDDFLYGGNFLASGETTVIEEDHNDFFDGGTGNDEIFGDDAHGRTGERKTGIAIESSVWYDNDLDGVRDENENGAGGVTVELFTQSGPTLVDSLVTTSDGIFEFTGLDPNNYFIRFTAPGGLQFTDQYAVEGASQPEDSDLDSDADTTTGETDVFDVDFDETETAVAAGIFGDPEVHVEDVFVTEGNTGQTQANLTVTLSGPTADPIEIDYTTKPDVAEAAKGDYTSTNGTLIFNPGQVEQQITVPILSDVTYEEHEQFEVQLDDPFNPGTITAFVTILNDDPIPQISISDYVPSPDAGEGDPATFIVSLSNPSQEPITVEYRTDAALTFQALDPEHAATPSPLADADFTSQVGMPPIEFKSGEIRQKIEVALTDDNLDEHEEHFFVDLFNASHALISDDRAYGIIPDDDQEVSVSIAPTTPDAGEDFITTVPEGNTNSIEVEFEVTLSEASAKTITVTYATAPGTAVESVFSGSSDLVDYEAKPTDLTPDDEVELVFEPGELTKTLSVRIEPDTEVEPDEEFFVNLLSATNAVIARDPNTENNHATVIIQDDDTVPDVDHGPWSIRFSDSEYQVDEEDGPAEITLIRTPGSSHAFAVFYTVDGTATAGSDYTAIFRQLVVFEGDELRKTIEIPIIDDALAEGDETVELFLRSPTGSPVNAEPMEATLTIVDNEMPTILLEDLTESVTEGDAGTQNYTFEVSLSEPSTGIVQVDYETVDLTAVSTGGDADFVADSGTLLLGGPHPISTTVDIVINSDTNVELTETFAFRLGNAVNAKLETDQQSAFGTIYDDDLTPVSGFVFYDANGNGFKDSNEKGLEGVTVNVTYNDSGSETTVPAVTNSDGEYTANVALGQVSIAVDENTLTSPYFPLFVIFFGSYELTTGNDSQTAEFLGATGITPFEDVGYQITTTFSTPSGSEDIGRGGTDDTIFGGPGDDDLDAGAGDDHVVGGHWMTATDGNAPINQGTYNATVTVVTDPPGDGMDTLHPVYDEGPIFSVDTSALGAGGSISGEIWFDDNTNHQQDGTDPLFTDDEVIVNLFDGEGNHVNSLVTEDGTYEFTGLFLNDDGSPTKYVVQFETPEGFELVSPNQGGETQDSDAVTGGRTDKIELTEANPTETDVDAGLRPADFLPSSVSGGFEFGDPSYSVAEDVENGVVTVTVVRGNSFEGQAVVVRTQDGTGANAAVEGTNYNSVSILLYFEVGETAKQVDIPILDTNTLDFCDTLHFTLVLRLPTGQPLDESTVYIYGEGAGTISDDDTIEGGGDWDLILGDSGVIPSETVIAESASLNDITSVGGPGDDIIHGGNGPDYIDAQLGDDVIGGNEGQDIVRAGLGNDEIQAELDDDEIDGQHGMDTVVSVRDVPWIELNTTGATTADLMHRNSETATPLSTFSLANIEVARLFGGYRDNTFDLSGWDGSAYISGGNGEDTLLAENDSDMTLTDANLNIFEQAFFFLVNGFTKTAALILPNDSTYHLGGLEAVTLTGGAADNVLDASGFSADVTLVGLEGNDTLIGGSGHDTFAYAADSALGTDTITGNGGRDTLDFSATTAAVTVDLGILDPASQSVNANLDLILKDKLENVIGGSGNDTLTGNDLDNRLLGGPGDDTLEGGAGSETYVFDTDDPWGHETIIENAGDPGQDTIDFSGTATQPIQLNLSILGSQQTVNTNLTLTIQGEGVEEVIGGSLNDQLTGNSSNNILRGGPGEDTLSGKSGDDILDGGSGNDDLNGGAGTDEINEQADTDFALSDTELSRGTGETDQLDNIETAHLSGGTSANTFDLTGWTGSGSLDGNDSSGSPRIDTVIAAADADFTLTDASLVISSNSGPINLSSIDAVELTAGPGDNTLDASGFTGDTRLSAGPGNDILIGGSGRDILLGGLGNDTLTGNPGNDRIEGGTGDDELTETRDARLFLIFNSALIIDESPAPLDEEGDILSGLETAVLTGGAGANRFDVSGWTAGEITVNGEGGNDVVVATGQGTVVLEDTGIQVAGGTGTINLNSIETANLTGSENDDTLDASAFTGSAVLVGLGGNDTLISGQGDDTLRGDDGDDLFQFNEDAVLDSDSILGGDGVDTLDFSAFTAAVTIDLSIIGAAQPVAAGELELTLGAEDIEVVQGGAGADLITGNALDNTFTGGAGADNLDGLAGTNTIRESMDADFTLTDISLEIGGTTDTLANIQNAELTGGAGDNTLDASGFTGGTELRGAEGADNLLGGSGIDLLIGGAGNDTLRGGNGNDTYQFDVDLALGEDTVDELPGAAGFDTLDFSGTEMESVTVDLSDTAQQTVHGANLLLTLTNGDSLERIVGGDQGDTLTGNSLDNRIDGGLGADDLDGNGGLNTIEAERDADFTLTDGTLAIDGETDTLANFQRARLIGGDGSNTLDASAFTLGGVALFGEGGNDVLIGSDAGDSLLGGDGNDQLFSNAGSDLVQGAAGNDTLHAGADDDILFGGTDNDTYVFDQSQSLGSDTVVESAGGGAYDVLQGVGLSGVDVDLHIDTPQVISSNLTLRLANVGQVEDSF